MADNKPSNRERIAQIVSGIEEGIKNLFDSEKYREYLRTMSRFHSYSFNNTMLIHMQMPSATHVAGFNRWKNQFGRHVKKGERGLTIIAPTPYKKKISEIKQDPDTKAPLLDSSGQAIVEEKEVEIPLFRPVKVFDVSQTEGRPLPTLASDLTGNVQHYEAFMEALQRMSVPIRFRPLRENLDGFFDMDSQTITLREGMSQVQTVCAAIHEIAHSVLHNKKKDKGPTEVADGEKEPPKPKNKNTIEIEAESISYAVCAFWGIETGENSFGYLASWSKDRTLPELKASLETISKTADSLITEIEKHFQQVCKERGIDLSQQPELAAAEKPVGLVTHVMEATAPIVQEPRPSHDNTEELHEHPDREETTPSDTTLDQYPMPDAGCTLEKLEDSFCYLDSDMLPLSKDRAAELLEKDFTIYAIVDGGSAEMLFDRDDLDERPADAMFTVPTAEWEASPDFHDAVMKRMERQAEREMAFLGHTGDCFAIYQIKYADPDRLRFMNMDWLESQGLTPNHANYDLIYTGELTAHKETPRQLEALYEKFNICHPADYHSPSLSVSDIIALKQGGMVSYHYCDSIGFRQLEGFLAQGNPLKNTEMAVEDDYGMIDGIINNGVKDPTVADLEAQVKAGQSISLMDLANATHRERQAKRKNKKSVMEKLMEKPPQTEPKKTAPKRSAEKER